MFIALAELLGFLADLDSKMFGGQLRGVVVLIALHAKMGILGDAVPLGVIGGYFVAVLAEGGLALLLLLGVDHIVDDVGGEDLVVLEDHVLVPEDLGVFLLVVEVDGLKALGAGDGVVDELVLPVAVGLPHRYLVHYAADLLLCVPYPVKTHVEYHPRLVEVVALLADLEELVGLVELIGREEGLEDDAALGVGAEGRGEVGARYVVYLFYHHRRSAQGQLQLELDELPLVGARLYFGVLF